MPDMDELLEDSVEDIEARILKIYREAKSDIDETMNAFAKRYRQQDGIMRGKLARGEITDAQYQSWKMGQVFIGDRWQSVRDSIASTLLHANRSANAIIEGKRKGIFVTAHNYQAYQIDRDFDFGLSFDLYDNATVTRLLRDQPELLPRRVVNGSKDKAWNRTKISNSIMQSIITGESIPDTAKRLSKKLASDNMKAITRYARTAMTGAQNAGRVEAMREARDMGIWVKKKWLSTLDTRTRDAHRHLDGDEAEIDEPFDSDLGEIQFPGDPEADPGNVYNCRCTLTYVYPEYRQQGKRYVQETGEYVRGDMTYKEWEAGKRTAGGLMSGGEDGIIEMPGSTVYTKSNTGEIPEPMDANRFERMKAGLSRHGIEVRRATTVDDIRYMNYIGAEAVTQWPNQIMYVGGVRPSASAMFEECIHIGQYWKYGEEAMMRNQTLMEALANKKLLDHAVQYGLSPQDVRSIEKNYQFWMNRLASEGGSLDDINDIPVIPHKKR